MSWEEEELRDELYEKEGREYCDVFGSEFVGSSQIRNLLEDFMIRKTITSSDFLKNMAAILHKFVKWLHEKVTWKMKNMSIQLLLWKGLGATCQRPGK